MSSNDSIAELLRERLRADARLVDLPERRPERAADRARARRRHRRAGLVGGAVVLLAAATAVPVLRGSGSTEGDVATTGEMFVRTGPLTLDWQRHAGGPGASREVFQGDDGVIYALSTAPGGGASSEDRTKTLYRLGDDGTWQPVVLDGDPGTAPDAIDVSSAGGLLYAVSTAPVAGDSSVARLSTSGDGGVTWSTEDLPAVAPPSDQVAWDEYHSMAVESRGATTLALVTTSFEVADPEEIFPEMASSESYVAVPREEGLVLVRYYGLTTAPDEDSARSVQADGDPSGAEEGAEEEVRTVPWSQIGVNGLAALHPPSRVFRAGDDGWEPLDSPGGNVIDLVVAGGRFVALSSSMGYRDDGAGSSARASADGSSWTDVALPATGRVVGVNDVLVDVPDDFTGVVQASTDGGVTWQPVDLTTAAGIEPGRVLTSVSGGPLGLALVTSEPDGTDQTLTVTGDLVDWTTTPLREVTGIDEPVGESVFVGADRIVVRATPYGDLDEATPPPETVTAVATPTRAG
jgi:hypothetical protein